MTSKVHLHIPDQERRQLLLDRIERATELPLLALSFLMIPLLVGPYLWDLSKSEEAIFISLDGFIWAIFAIDLVVKTTLAPHRLAYLRGHWLEVIIVLVPFFRPFRILRILLFGSRAFSGSRRLIHVDFLLVYGIGLVMIAATLVTTFEDGETGAIASFPDALWWAVVTITTVGYGDIVPVTATGRTVAFVLMLGGIAFFSGVTANLASHLVKGDDSQKIALESISRELEILRTEISKLRQQ